MAGQVGKSQRVPFSSYYRLHPLHFQSGVLQKGSGLPTTIPPLVTRRCHIKLDDPNFPIVAAFVPAAINDIVYRKRCEFRERSLKAHYKVVDVANADLDLCISFYDRIKMRSKQTILLGQRDDREMDTSMQRQERAWIQFLSKFNRLINCGTTSYDTRVGDYCFPAIVIYNRPSAKTGRPFTVYVVPESYPLWLIWSPLRDFNESPLHPVYIHMDAICQLANYRGDKGRCIKLLDSDIMIPACELLENETVQDVINRNVVDPPPPPPPSSGASGAQSSQGSAKAPISSHHAQQGANKSSRIPPPPTQNKLSSGSSGPCTSIIPYSRTHAKLSGINGDGTLPHQLNYLMGHWMSSSQMHGWGYLIGLKGGADRNIESISSLARRNVIPSVGFPDMRIAMTNIFEELTSNLEIVDVQRSIRIIHVMESLLLDIQSAYDEIEGHWNDMQSEVTSARLEKRELADMKEFEAKFATFVLSTNDKRITLGKFVQKIGECEHEWNPPNETTPVDTSRLSNTEFNLFKAYNFSVLVLLMCHRFKAILARLYLGRLKDEWNVDWISAEVQMKAESLMGVAEFHVNQIALIDNELLFKTRFFYEVLTSDPSGNIGYLYEELMTLDKQRIPHLIRLRDVFYELMEIRPGHIILEALGLFKIFVPEW